MGEWERRMMASLSATTKPALKPTSIPALLSPLPSPSVSLASPLNFKITPFIQAKPRRGQPSTHLARVSTSIRAGISSMLHELEPLNLKRSNQVYAATLGTALDMMHAGGSGRLLRALIKCGSVAAFSLSGMGGKSIEIVGGNRAGLD